MYTSIQGIPFISMCWRWMNKKFQSQQLGSWQIKAVDVQGSQNPQSLHKDCHEATEAYYVCRSILAPTQIEQVPRKGQELGGKGWKYPLPQKVWEGKQDLFFVLKAFKRRRRVV